MLGAILVIEWHCGHLLLSAFQVETPKHTLTHLWNDLLRFTRAVGEERRGETMEEDIRCSFLSTINKTFLRTNRSSGQKSLRYDVCLEMA